MFGFSIFLSKCWCTMLWAVLQYFKSEFLKEGNMLALILVIQNNIYQKAIFLNTSGRYHSNYFKKFGEKIYKCKFSIYIYHYVIFRVIAGEWVSPKRQSTGCASFWSLKCWIDPASHVHVSSILTQPQLLSHRYFNASSDRKSNCIPTT